MNETVPLRFAISVAFCSIVIVGITALRASGAMVLAVGVIGAIILFALGVRWGLIRRSLDRALFVTAALAFLAGCIFVRWWTTVSVSDVVGDIKGFSATCQLRDIHVVSNSSNYEAAVRDANCPGAFAQGQGFFVVFVHRKNERNDQENLVFQYEPGFNGRVMTPPPTLKWLAPQSLKVTVNGLIERLVVKRDSYDGITITYSLGQVESRDPGQNP